MKNLTVKDVMKEKDDLVSVHFDSITSLLSFDEREIEREENAKKFKKLLKSKKEDKWNGSEWYGETNKSPSQVVNHALMGDEVLLKKHLDKKIKKLKDLTGKNTTSYTQQIQVVKRKSFMTDEGDELCLDKLYAGEIDTAWRKTKRIVIGQEQKLITLFLNIGGTAGVKPEESFWRSAVAVLICNELESTGKQVQIVVGSGTANLYSGYKKFTGSIVVKKYNERITMERLAAMSHIGFHRTFGFGVKCCTNKRTNLDTMGRTIEVNQKLIPIHFQEEIESGKARFVFIDGCLNESGAKRALENCYKQLEDLTSSKAA
jgi:hypothetical protein